MSSSLHYFLQFVAIFILLSWSIYVNYRNGQLNMGCIYTMCIGAYFSVYACLQWGWPIWLAALVAVLVGTLFAFLPALRLARVPSFTLVVVTLGFIGIVQAVVRNTMALGGARGLFGVPSIPYWMPISWIIVVAMGFLIYRLDHSRFGRGMEMTYVDPDLAASMGVNTYWGGVFLQSFAGFLGSIAGVLYAFSTSAILPECFGFPLLLRICCFFFVGGRFSVWGVVIATPILWAISVFLPESIAVWKDVIYGVLLMIVLLTHPDGLIDRSLLRVIGNKIRQWRGLKKIGY